MTEVRCVLGAHASVGEGPVWVAEERALYWVDIHGPTLNRFEPATGDTRHWIMPAPIGSFGLTRKGRAGGRRPGQGSCRTGQGRRRVARGRRAAISSHPPAR